MREVSFDSFFNGRIRISQNQSGYRFSIDAVLLAYHARPRPSDRVLDLGTGCGVIPLIMAFRHPDIRVYGVEVQKELSDLAGVNIRENRMLERITILCQDMKALKPDMIAGPVDLVVSNPPYRKPDSGRVNPNHQRAVARHEIKANLPDVILTAERMLRAAGRFVVVYTAERTTDLLTQMRTDRIEPKSLRYVHSHRHAEAKLVLVEGVKGGRAGIRIEPPLILYNRAGDYTPEVARMFEP